MDNRRGTNVLLLAIAILLALIVIKLYDVSFVAEAQAQEDAAAVRIVGCFKKYDSSRCEWRPVRVDEQGSLDTH